jgi:tetratricopeptide (TPR) repeat protein
MMIKQGKYDDAIALAEDISTVPVMQAEAYVIAAEVFQRRNQLQEAVGALESALQMNPQHVRAHLLLGAIYYDTGAMRYATDHLRQAAELDPNDKNALMLSAKIFKEYEQYQEALSDYEQLLTRSLADDVQIYVKIEIATCLLELRQLDAAREILETCPDTVGVLALRAAIAETAGDFSAAAKLARSTLEIAPNNITAGMILGRISVTERNWDEAVPVLQKLVELRPYDHEPRLLYGRALVGAGELERGQAEIEAATALKDTFLKFADMHQQAIKQPDDPIIRVELGRLAEQLGKIDLARTWYQAALGLAPDNAEASDALERLAP